MLVISEYFRYTVTMPPIGLGGRRHKRRFRGGLNSANSPRNLLSFFVRRKK